MSNEPEFPLDQVLAEVGRVDVLFPLPGREEGLFRHAGPASVGPECEFSSDLLGGVVRAGRVEPFGGGGGSLTRAKLLCALHRAPTLHGPLLRCQRRLLALGAGLRR